MLCYSINIFPLFQPSSSRGGHTVCVCVLRRLLAARGPNVPPSIPSPHSTNMFTNFPTLPISATISFNLITTGLWSIEEDITRLNEYPAYAGLSHMHAFSLWWWKQIIRHLGSCTNDIHFSVNFLVITLGTFQSWVFSHRNCYICRCLWQLQGALVHWLYLGKCNTCLNWEAWETKVIYAGCFPSNYICMYHMPMLT